MASSGLTGQDTIVHLSQFLVNNDITTPEMWAFGAIAGSSILMAHRVSGVWSAVTPDDTPTNTAPDVYNYTAQTLNAKHFFFYRSAQDRLHVWDGTFLRRTGLAQPAAPSVANSVPAGSYATTRYFRVRYTEMSGATVKRRSEHSATTTFTPSGANDGAVITKPAAISEHETHWEVEASTDNSNFYRIAQVAVGTTTYTDNTAFATGYASEGVLSDEIFS